MVKDRQFWEQRYQAGTDRWDLGTAAPAFVSLLASKHAPKPGKVAVLGCGRGYDALLFAAYGFEVIGFDFAPAAIADAIAAAKATERSAQFLQRDIFDLLPEFAGVFDYVVEHTCFCAIAPEQRPDYVELAKGLLKPRGELLGIFFTHSRPGGPPFGSTVENIQTIFTPAFEVLQLTPVLNSVPQRRGEEHFGRLRRSLPNVAT